MFNISIEDICRVCGGTACNCVDLSCEPERIVIDSREVREGDIFAAFAGEKSNGYDYIPAACNNGAVCCLVEYLPEGCKAPCIVVDSVENAMADIAEYFRTMLNIPVVGITGSVGKTTAKEMISSVLSKRFNVLKTDKNLNNQLGVPITVSRAEKEHTAAVVEMGVSKIGDMDLLGRIVKPEIAVFTNIGHAHLEFLHSLEGVYNEKSLMIKYMPEDGTVIINNDDEILSKTVCKQRVISYGVDHPADVTASDIVYSEDGCSSSFKINCKNESFPVYVPAFGKHIVYASLMAAAAGFAVGMNKEEIAAGLKEYKTIGRRSAVYKLERFTLIDDCYNANPDSVKNAVKSMVSIPGRHVCVLGDMRELGPESSEMHRDVGRYAAENAVDFMILAGEQSEYTYQGAVEAGCKAVYFKTRDDMLDKLPDLLINGDVILVKASLGSCFDKVSESIKAL